MSPPSSASGSRHSRDVLDISFYSSTENPSIITAYLSSVPAEGLESIDAKFKAALARLAGEEIDMKRMASVVERSRLQLLNAIETDAADALSNSILTGASPLRGLCGQALTFWAYDIDALFGAEDGSDLAPQLSEEDYTVVSKWTGQEWQELLSQCVNRQRRPLNLY